MHITSLFKYFLNKLLRQVVENIDQDESAWDIVEIPSQILSKNKKTSINLNNSIFLEQLKELR